jgi:hypothetical protein
LLLRMLKDAFSNGVRARAAAVAPIADANPLERWFADHAGRQITRWPHYFEIYHRHLARYRGKRPIVLEIGVAQGGSIDMWHAYFGEGCRLYGVDIDPRCATLASANTTILIGDQADRNFLARLRSELPRVDILIDDGGHRMEQQIAVFEELYSHVADDGVYLCEDLHTSYWRKFGGGFREPASYIEYSKSFVDRINAWFSEETARLDVDDFTRSTHSLHYYNSVLVIEKRVMGPPENTWRGRPTL